MRTLLFARPAASVRVVVTVAVALCACGGGEVESTPGGRGGGAGDAGGSAGRAGSGGSGGGAGAGRPGTSGAGISGAAGAGGTPPPAQGGPNGGDDPTGTVDTSTAPAFAPTLLVSTLVGGAGKQYVRSVEFAADGRIVARGKGFTLTYNADLSRGTLEGDAATDDGDPYQGGNKLAQIGNKVSDPRNGQTYDIGYRQVGGNLQQPYLSSSKGWKFWGWNETEAGSLRADSRGYDIWLMPNGRIALVAWTDGGNSTLTRDPQDLGKELEATKGALQSSAAGLATLWLLVDADAGRPVSGTFLYTQAMTRAVDRWGRIYIPSSVSKNSTITNPFNQAANADAGLIVLRPDLKQADLNIRLGGACTSGSANLSALAVRDDRLLMGGTHCSATANFPATSNAYQSKPGGDQDGWLVVIKLR